MKPFHDRARTQAEFFAAELQEGKRQKKPVEFIITSTWEDYRKLADSLSALGRIRRLYSTIPSFSIELAPEDAEALNCLYQNKRCSRSFEKQFGKVTGLIRGIDISATYKTVPCPVQPETPVFRSRELWNLKDIGAYAAQRISTGTGAKVGIIDTGIEYTHRELSGKVSKKGYNFADNSENFMDDNGHGTHVAGTCSGATVGISTSAVLHAIKVLDAQGSGSESDVMAGIDWAVANGLDIVNMSLGAPYASDAFQHICTAAYKKGLLLVAAAGNSEYGPNYPAAFGAPVIAVAAVDENNEHAYFSNIYSTNDISAPGVRIVSSYLNNTLEALDGTSMATPHVTGTIALAIPLMQQHPASLEAELEKSASPLESDTGYDDRDVFGAGLLQADGFLERILRDDGIARFLKDRVQHYMR